MFHNEVSARPETAPSMRAGRRTTGLAVLLSFVLAVVAVIDQQTGQTLAAYSVSMYQGYDVTVEPGAIYGLLYTSAGILIVLWLLAGATSWRQRRWSSGALIAVTTVNILLALAMLLVTEYDQPVFPPLWGTLAALPAVAGIVAVVLHARARRTSRTAPPA